MQSPLPKEFAFTLVDNRDPLVALAAKELELAAQMTSLKRRNEFLHGRAAAQGVLLQLDFEQPTPAVLRGEYGQPLWPKGIIGSISHTLGRSVAVATNSKKWRSVGIDIETKRNLSTNILQRIATEDERRWAQSSRLGNELASLALFSAKEAVYKAMFPIVKRWFGFQEGKLLITDRTLTFTGHVINKLTNRQEAEFTGGIVVKNGLILSFVLAEK